MNIKHKERFQSPRQLKTVRAALWAPILRADRVKVCRGRVHCLDWNSATVSSALPDQVWCISNQVSSTHQFPGREIKTVRTRRTRVHIIQVCLQSAHTSYQRGMTCCSPSLCFCSVFAKAL